MEGAGRVLSPEEARFFYDRYGITEEDGVLMPVGENSFLFPPSGKEGMYLKHLDASVRLPVSSFSVEVCRYYRFHLSQLVPNAVNKLIAFEMLCRAVGIEPDLFVFRWYFRGATVGDNYTFYVRKNARAIVTDRRPSARQWQSNWLWVDSGLIRLMPHRRESISDAVPVLTEANKAQVKLLNSYEVLSEDFPEVILAGAGMSTAWRLRGVMPEFFVRVGGVEREVVFTDVLAKNFSGDLEYREIPLVDRVLPSFPFRNEGFIQRCVRVQEAERRMSVERSAASSVYAVGSSAGAGKGKALEESAPPESKENIISGVKAMK